MAVLQQAVRFGGRRVTRRLARSVPWIGTALALVTIGDAIRRKGVVCGSLDCTLNAIPFIGAVKNMAELVRGRDFLPDREPRRDGDHRGNGITGGTEQRSTNGVRLNSAVIQHS